MPHTGQPSGSPEEPIRIGISACLLGREVRYDGGHKRDAFLVETFGHLRGVGTGVSGGGDSDSAFRGRRCVSNATAPMCA